MNFRKEWASKLKKKTFIRFIRIVIQYIGRSKCRYGRFSKMWFWRKRPTMLRVSFWRRWIRAVFYRVFICAFTRIQLWGFRQIESTGYRRTIKCIVGDSVGIYVLKSSQAGCMICSPTWIINRKLGAERLIRVWKSLSHLPFANWSDASSWKIGRSCKIEKLSFFHHDDAWPHVAKHTMQKIEQLE